MLSNTEIGTRIENRRNSLGLTLDEVANQVGVAKSTIQRYEKGQIKKIKLPVIESIASVLEVNPDWLIGNTDNPTIIMRSKYYDSNDEALLKLISVYSNLNKEGKLRLLEYADMLSVSDVYKQDTRSKEA